MRILGIDPGIGRCGWGIIDKAKGRLGAVAHGCIETSSKESLSERLLTIYREVFSIIDEYQPQVLAIEELFFNTNAKTALIVGQARGVIIVASAQKSLPLAVYTPLQVKMALTGYGRADKNQIGQMVKVLLKLKEIPKPDDTADALAVALTHAFISR